MVLVIWGIGSRLIITITSLIRCLMNIISTFFFFQAEDGIRDPLVTGVQTCALPISRTGGAIPPAAQAPSPGGGGRQRRAELHRLFETSALVRGTRFARRIRARWAEDRKSVV